MRVTIKMFQELNSIASMELTDLDKSTLLVQTLTGKTTEQIENMPIHKYNRLCNKIEEAFEIANNKMMEGKPKNIVRANGNLYLLNYDIAKPPMNAGRYVEIATFSNDFIGNMHKIMATMATPLRWSWKGLIPIKVLDYTSHEKIANDMLHLEFKHAYHSAIFFLKVFTESILNSRNYFMSIAEQKREMEITLNRLQETLDGFIQPKWSKNLKGSL